MALEPAKGVFAEVGRQVVGHEALPDESECHGCGYFNTAHPDAKRILLARDPRGGLLQQARCRCAGTLERARSAEALRRQMANLPHSRGNGLAPRTIDSFRVIPGTEEMVEAARAFLLGKPPHILVLSGSKGVGKSHILEAVGRVLLDHGRPVRYEMVSSLLDRLRHCYDENSQEDLYSLMQWYQDQYALLLDDLGMEKATGWGTEKLTALVDERLRQGYRTVITTNLSKEQLAGSLGERLASRLYAVNPELNEVQLVVVPEQVPDYRSR